MPKGASGKTPAALSTSAKLSAVARTRISTSPGPGSCRSVGPTVRLSTSPGAGDFQANRPRTHLRRLRLPHLFNQVRAQPTLVQKHKPIPACAGFAWSRHRRQDSFPSGQKNQSARSGFLLSVSSTGRSSNRVIAEVSGSIQYRLSFEGVSRQRHAAASLAIVQLARIQFAAEHPQVAVGFQDRPPGPEHRRRNGRVKGAQQPVWPAAARTNPLSVRPGPTSRSTWSSFSSRVERHSENRTV